MAFFKGYQYTTEIEAIAAKSQCNEYYGIPLNLSDVTKNWVDYRFAEFNNPQFYYIIYDETLIPILGEPIDFEVVLQEINLTQ